MSKLFVKFSIALFLLCMLLTSCSAITVEEGIPIKSFNAQSLSPIEVVNTSVVMSLYGKDPLVTVTFKNVSDKKVLTFSWVAVSFDKDGNLCSNWRTEGSCVAQAMGLYPGECIVSDTRGSDTNTTKVKIVIKELIYDSGNEGGGRLIEWKNEMFEADLQRAKE